MQALLLLPIVLGTRQQVIYDNRMSKSGKIAATMIFHLLGDICGCFFSFARGGY
jgi:hypothetical protein